MGLKLNEVLNKGGLEGVVLESLDLWQVQGLHCNCSPCSSLSARLLLPFFFFLDQIPHKATWIVWVIFNTVDYKARGVFCARGYCTVILSCNIVKPDNCIFIARVSGGPQRWAYVTIINPWGNCPCYPSFCRQRQGPFSVCDGLCWDLGLQEGLGFSAIASTGDAC